MKNITIILILTLISAMMPADAFAQADMQGKAEVSNIVYKIQDQTLAVKMTVDISDIQNDATQTRILTPVLVGKEASAELPSIELMGRRAYMYYLRNNSQAVSPNTVVARRTATRADLKNGQCVIDYSAAIPYQPWMDQVDVVIRESSCWCDDILKQTGSEHIASIDIKPYLPQYRISFAEPGTESVKLIETGEPAYINFRLNSATIREDYKNNKQELASIIESVNRVGKDNTVTITGIVIDGWTSPEATVPYNQRLSQQRADALADYISGKTGIDRNMISATGHGEAWSLFRQEVEQLPQLAGRERVLKIIDDSTRSFDTREWLLSQIEPQDIYRRLVNEVYPGLRRNDYSIEYCRNTANISTDQALKILETNPRELPLGEIYRIARNYPEGSAEYNRIMEIALQTYPDRVEAAVNGAAERIARNDLAGAMKLLERVDGNDSRVLNAIGVIHAMQNEPEKAREAWTRAAAGGSDDARFNLDELAKAQSAAEGSDTITYVNN